MGVPNLYLENWEIKGKNQYFHVLLIWATSLSSQIVDDRKWVFILKKSQIREGSTYQAAHILQQINCKERKGMEEKNVD